MVPANSQTLVRTSIRDLHRRIVSKEVTISQICKRSLKQIDETNHQLNAYITVCKQEALDRAQELDQQIEDGAVGAPTNPLFGIPISIKDNFCTKDVLTTCGSRMLNNFLPPYTATVVSKLHEAGCIMTGKTNMDEFAMGSSCTTSHYGPAANPCRAELQAGQSPKECPPSDWFMAGGSSTGSAISVATGSCFASIGTDTGGSARQPASLNGVVGFKPTYGLISRFGLVPLVHSLDVVSILARSVEDVELVFDAIVGQDDNDLTTVDHMRELKNSIKLPPSQSSEKLTIRVGIPNRFINKGEASADVRRQFEKVRDSLSKNVVEEVNFELVNLELTNSSLATECYTIISSAEIASNMSCYDGVKYGHSTALDDKKEFDRNDFFRANRDEGFGAEVKKRILLGNFFLLEENRDKYLVQALKLRRMIRDEFAEAFGNQKVDVIVMPSTPTTSISYEEWLSKQDENKLFREDYFLIPSNLANLPSISLPCGSSADGLPVGLQLIGGQFHDSDLLKIAKLFEQKILNYM